MSILKQIFGKRSEPEATPDPEPAEPYEHRRFREVTDELHVVGDELALAGKAIAAYREENQDLRIALIDGEVVTQLGAMQADPVLASLERWRDRVLEKRNGLLHEHARLKMALGLTR